MGKVRVRNFFKIIVGLSILISPSILANFVGGGSQFHQPGNATTITEGYQGPSLQNIPQRAPLQNFYNFVTNAGSPQTIVIAPSLGPSVDSVTGNSNNQIALSNSALLNKPYSWISDEKNQQSVMDPESQARQANGGVPSFLLSQFSTLSKDDIRQKLAPLFETPKNEQEKNIQDKAWENIRNLNVPAAANAAQAVKTTDGSLVKMELQKGEVQIIDPKILGNAALAAENAKQTLDKQQTTADQADQKKSPTPSASVSAAEKRVGDAVAGGDKGYQSADQKKSIDPSFEDLRHPVDKAESDFQASTYVAYAKDALGQEGNTPYTDNKIFKDAPPEIKSQLQSAYSALAKTDFSPSQIAPLENLIYDKNFQTSAPQLLGKDKLELINNATLAAAAVAAGANLNGQDLNLLSKAFELATGKEGPVSGKSAFSRLPKLGEGSNFALNFLTKGNIGAQDDGATGLSSAALEWIELAKLLSSNSTAKSLVGKYDVDKLQKGRIELENLIRDLRNFKTLRLLNLVNENANLNFHWLYREGIGEAMIAIIRTAKLKKTEDFPKLYSDEFPGFVLRVKGLLKEANAARSRAKLVGLFKNIFADEEFQRLWSSYTPVNYEKLRLATGVLIFSYAFRAFESDPNEKKNDASQAFAYLVRSTMDQIREKNKERTRSVFGEKDADAPVPRIPSSTSIKIPPKNF